MNGARQLKVSALKYIVMALRLPFTISPALPSVFFLLLRPWKSFLFPVQTCPRPLSRPFLDQYNPMHCAAHFQLYKQSRAGRVPRKTLVAGKNKMGTRTTCCLFFSTAAAQALSFHSFFLLLPVCLRLWDCWWINGKFVVFTGKRLYCVSTPHNINYSII